MKLPKASGLGTRAASLHLRLLSLAFTLNLPRLSSLILLHHSLQQLSPCLGSRGVTADTHTHARPRIPKSQKQRYAQSLARVTFRVAHTSLNQHGTVNTHQQALVQHISTSPQRAPHVSPNRQPCRSSATAGGLSLVSSSDSRFPESNEPEPWSTSLQLSHPSSPPLAPASSTGLHQQSFQPSPALSCVVCFTAVLVDVENEGAVVGSG
ncbi:uncharacterized protein BDZ83DRAFT_45895 [Colletotrichum acutatum]|uniref:Uncharacterized protein n=1 Tax=Glomerella acutata TaxID=27357 RepID=A0AAD8UCE9_GLOAC|nr:uncharacterized protein BDZ83DRAFT_45895 [Colletotrichum acutatum]KAK1716058.1 hypothetical protein BDZ83DRAFT_45895 [Colletotrichum acutatum]